MTRGQPSNHQNPPAPAITLPKGGGAVRGIGEKFAANPVTGTAALTVPIALSPGRSGFGPELSVSYDSGSGNGPFGFGWQLSLPSITRKTDKGLPQYRDADESDVYVLSGVEDLVPVLRGDRTRFSDETTAPGYIIDRYRPRIEGLFARIERWTRKQDGDTHWRSISPDNVTTYYGRTGDSRIADPGDPRRVFSWLICESDDDQGNAMLYDYQAEDDANVDLAQAHEQNRTAASRSANRYLKRVRYGNEPSRLVQPDLSHATWMFEAVFDYGENHSQALPADGEGRPLVTASVSPSQAWPARQDPFSSYRPGFEVRTYRLCRRVLMFHHFPSELGTPDYLVRTTEFSYRETPAAAFVTGITHAGYRRQPDGSYLRKAVPSVDFEYTTATVQPDVREVDADSLASLPIAADGKSVQWIDLDGEGVHSVLAEHDNAWYYTRNVSPLTFAFTGEQASASARFEPMTEVASLPSFALASTGPHHFLDLAGDGQLDCVVLEPPLAGFFERTDDRQWSAFKPLESIPDIDWSDPNLRFIDLDGDGRADVLISDDDAFTWYRSLSESGFASGRAAPKPRDEEDGPTVALAAADQETFLADMSGDGLTDIVRIRNGEVCYWPNLGYGRFGARITMDDAPWFDAPDSFDPRRIRLADIDGSGVADIIYLGPDGVRLYFSEAGNRWSAPHLLPSFPQVDDLTEVQALDLLGTGTACLVWMSTLPGAAQRSMRYVDLMGGEKPHLLVRSRNNLGAETRVFYAPSTKFYLADRAAGTPWLTRLPFPVHVVERVETYDFISRNRFVTRYAYHHGFYDGVEREFRGFGRVDQFDTEELGALTSSGTFPDAVNVDAASYVPTVMTRTWFHTGRFIEGAGVSRHFTSEYWRESDVGEGVAGLSDAEVDAMLLPDSVLPSDLDASDRFEACRSLKGAVLRHEIYALDNRDEAHRPYTVSECNYTITRVQPAGPNAQAVFFTHARETVDFHYERKLYDLNQRRLADPRVSHSLVLAVDGFGNELQSVAVGYGRRRDDPDPLLTAADRARQSRTHVTCRDARYTNPVDEADAYRWPLAAETRTFELVKVLPDRVVPDITNFFGFDELVGKLAQAGDGAHDLPYEDVEAEGASDHHPYRRLIEHSRSLYRKNDLTAASPLGSAESLGLPFENYALALVPGVLAVYQRGPDHLLADPVPVLRDKGGYVLSQDKRDAGLFPSSDADGLWWLPSGRVFYSAGAAAAFADERDAARRHFFLPRRFLDPFGNESSASYDDHDLLPLETTDAVGNRVTAGERGPGGSIVNRHDYRVLQPALMTDANGNRAEVVFDALGMVAVSAVMDRTQTLGDAIDAALDPDPAPHRVDAFMARPRDGAVNAPESVAAPETRALLGNATTRIVYDLERFKRSGDPAIVATIIRDTHVSDLEQGEVSKLDVRFSYSDGFGRTIQMKRQAEPGPVLPGGATVNPRWVASGWTIFDNKGNPVRQYEPFFDDSHHFVFGRLAGVSPILFYDPAGRTMATLHPNHTWEKVIFDPWRQTRWDVNDTVAITDPRSDADVGAVFARLPDEHYVPGWLPLRLDPAHAAEAAARWPDPRVRAGETDAAVKAARHAGTPALAFADTLGRTFLTIAHNRLERNGATVDEHHATRVELDVEGNQRAVRDALGRIVMRYDYDMLGTRVHQASMEAGERWTLDDASGQPIRTWDSRGHAFRTEYDALRRPVASVVQGFDPAHPAAELTFARTEYGEGQIDDVRLNLRTRAFRIFDGAGQATTPAYDFKGNALRTVRQLPRNYQDLPDWSTDPEMAPETFATSATYDARSRPVTISFPDASVYLATFNEAGLLERVAVKLRGAQTATPFVANLDYDAKGQRARIDYGNGATTTYTYEPDTRRLAALETIRATGAGAFDAPMFADATRVQNLRYSYDPAGNITRIEDAALAVVFHDNQRVDARSDYTYDARYRLIAASGREHIAQSAFALQPPDANYRDYPWVGAANPNDPHALRQYQEQYEYDAVGNVLELIHRAVQGSWTRPYSYLERSQLDAATNNNRLSVTNADALNAEAYGYDGHGNMTAMPHLTLMRWDVRDQLAATARQAVNAGAPETTYFGYDGHGGRARKVTERPNGTRKNERIYLGGFEKYREFDSSGTVVVLERDTLHVTDDQHRIALVETTTPAVPERLIRYVLANHQGSASLELGVTGQLVSFEEYYPYGGTSYQSGPGAAEVSLKRYRYSGKEKDEETGLSYHAARYYATWLGRFVSADPAALAGGINLYEYASANPVIYVDPSGTAPKKYEKQRGKDTAVKHKEMKRNLADAKKKGYTPDPMQKRAEALGKKRGKTPKEHHHHKGVKQSADVKADPKQMGDPMSSLWSTKSDPKVSATIDGKPRTHHNVAKHLDFDEQAKGPKTKKGPKTAKALADAAGTSKWRLPDTVDLTERAKMDWTRSPADPTAAKVKPFDPAGFDPKAPSVKQMQARNTAMAEKVGSADLKGFGEYSPHPPPGLGRGAAVVGKLAAVVEPIMWYTFFRDYYKSQTTTQRTVGWTQQNMPWVPLQVAEAMLKQNLLHEGDHFVNTNYLIEGGDAVLWVIHDGKAWATEYKYDEDEDAFIHHHDGPEII